MPADRSPCSTRSRRCRRREVPGARVREGRRDQGRLPAPEPLRGDQQGSGGHALGARRLRRGHAPLAPDGPPARGRGGAGHRRPRRQQDAANSGLDPGDFIQPATDTLAKFKGKTYGFLNWNYNVVYWARGDLLGHPEEKAAFKKRYGHDLGPARTLQQMRDIAEFFTRKKGDKLAGQTLESDFYGIVLEGIKEERPSGWSGTRSSRTLAATSSTPRVGRPWTGPRTSPPSSSGPGCGSGHRPGRPSTR